MSTIEKETSKILSVWEKPDRLYKLRQWKDSGKPDREISSLMGISARTLKAWKSRSTLLRAALNPAGEITQDDDDRVARVVNTIARWKADRYAQKRPLTLESLAVALDTDTATLKEWAAGLDPVDDSVPDAARWVERHTNAGNGSNSIYGVSKSDIDSIKLRRFEALQEQINKARENRKAISKEIKKAITCIKSELVDKTMSNNGSAGAMFNLKCNFGYIEKKAIEINDKTYTVKWLTKSIEASPACGGNDLTAVKVDRK